MRSNGYRRGTRTLFRKDFKKRGMPNPTKVLQPFKMGDLVDCKVDPSIVKGMPHKYYHGQTGKVFNLNPRSVGVIFYRKVGHKYIERTVHARIEHLHLSKSNLDTKTRYAEHQKRVLEAREAGDKVTVVKRQPAGPRASFTISKSNNTPVEVGFKAYNPVF